ncbi:SOS response-associated peptidase family protein [Terasakiella sp. SH-1]|uniref:SOS response-associated peptidase n=1 Tax=Terasakiella sp. SH-1 TaxID=2560057 RepID=UPI001073F75A|nr:SOS response-associated peptidase family protein [Terasakiella sp. SH-1]
MCSTFEADILAKVLQQTYGLSTIPKSKRLKRPTDDALVIDQMGHAEVLPWGFQVEWSTKPLINARAETLLEKATFRPALQNRCLVPATAWFEYRQDEGGKLKNRISINGITQFAMAGLYDKDRFTIITCAPHPAIAHIHDRMPVLLPPIQYQRWLDKKTQTQQLGDLLAPPKNIAFDIDEEQPREKQLGLF